jgi:RHS repeat-associated protein
MTRVLRGLRWLLSSLLVAGPASAAWGQQTQYSGPVFYTTLTPQSGDSGALKVICAGSWVDLNCDNVVNLQDAILYADLCAVAGEGEAEGLLNSSDPLQMRCRKAVAVAEAFAAINNRPDLFTDEDDLTWLVSADCPPTIAIPTVGGSSQIQCSGMATIAATIVQHVAGILPDSPALSPGVTIPVPPLPPNRPSGNPNIFVPPPAEPPAPATPNLPKVVPGEEFTPNPSPCTVPTPTPTVLPGGDSPIICCGEINVDGGNPCNVAPNPQQPGPGKSDVIICSSAGPCAPPEPTHDPNSPYNMTIPKQDYCVSSNPCIPTCDDIPCSEGPFKFPGIPTDTCASSGPCQVPEVDTSDRGLKIDDSWKYQPSGIFEYVPEVKPQEKQPIIYCGDTESAATQASGSGTEHSTCQPVDLVSGHKMEEETDLTVSLAGRDFSVIRQYSSNPHDIGQATNGGYVTGWGVFGYGWSSPLFQQITLQTIDTVPTLVLLGNRQNSFTKFCDDGSGGWKPCGPSRDSVTSSSVTVGGGSADVYRITSPGQGETLFYRTGALAGRLLHQRDEHGNSSWFEYRWFGTSPNVVPRLYRVYLNGTGIADAQALIEFGYNLVEEGLTPDDALNGRIARVVCFRFAGTGEEREAIETHRVDYTYKRSSDGLSPDCGTPGDLIQVTKFSRVDVGAPRKLYSTGPAYGPDYEQRVSVTQYRYHRANEPETGEERLDVTGSYHCLKSVFRPAQIEYYAELLNRDNAWLSSTAMSVRDAAQRLLLLPDRSLAVTRGSEQYKVFELASKIVGYGGTSIGAGNKVAVQYLQTGGCGCGGSTQSIRQDFTRVEWTGGGDYSQPGRTTKLTESYRSTGTTPTWVAFRRRLVDNQRVGSSNSFYGIYDVLEELNSSGAVTRRWITRSVYNTTTRLLTEEWTPSACVNMTYTAAGATSANSAPTLSGSGASTGLVNYYVYNSDKRLTEAGVRQASASTGTPVVKIEYDATHKHLPTKIERIADPNASGGVGTETSNFEYTFYSGSYPHAVKSIRTIVEAERPEENGPAGTDVKYSTLTVLDEKGQTIWSASADGTLTHRTYDERTGRVAQIQVNVDPSDMGSLSGVYTDWAGTYGISTSYPSSDTPITYTIDRDEQGRITQTQSPGPDGTITQQWCYGYLRIDEPGLNERSGVPYVLHGILPHKWGSGSTAGASGPIALVWSNAGGGSVQVGRFETKSAAPLTRSDLSSLLMPTPPTTSTPLAGYLGDEAHRKLLRYSLSNQLTSLTAWHDVDGGLGRSSDDRYTAYNEYDPLGRRFKTTSATGDITKVDYEPATGRIIAEYHGTTDGNLQLTTSYFYDSAGATSQGVGNGNLTVTQLSTGESSPNDVRTRAYTYDFRDRVQGITNPLPPHQFFVYDNLGRVTEAGDFTGSAAPTSMSSTDRGSYAKSFYSQRGLPYRSAVAIDPSASSPGFIESHRWFDSVGRTVASMGPDSPGVKVTYDRLGRVSAGYITDRGGDTAAGSGSYADAIALTGDTVLEQTEYSYTDASEGNFLHMVKHLVRRHDAPTGSGALSITPASGQSAGSGIATYTGYRYDSAGRPARTVEFGTNKAPGTDRLDDSFTNASSAPTLSATGALPDRTTSGFENALVTAMSYNPRGLLDEVIDPKGRHHRTLYDDLDRVIANIENAVGTGVGVTWNSTKARWGVTGVSSSDPVDQNRVTSYAHVKFTEGSEATWRLRQAAHFPPRTIGSTTVDAQVTEVVYGVSSSTTAGTVASLIASAGLPREVRFPDEGSGEPGTADQYKVRYAYTRLGELRAAQDQNGTVHQYTRDAFGRVINDVAAAAGGSAVDMTVSTIGVAFDTLGRVTDVRSLGGSPTPAVRDHVRYAYNALGMLTDLTQDPDSDIDSNGSTEPSRLVHYNYDIANFASGNRARATSLVYPVVPGTTPTTLTTQHFLYGVSSSLTAAVDNAIGRVTGLSLEDETAQASTDTLIAEYFHVGLSATAQTDLADLGVQLDRTIDSTGRRNFGVSPTQTVGAYPGWDRFARVKRNTWVNTAYDIKTDNSGPNRREYASLSYLYDQVGNPIARKNEQLGADFVAESGLGWLDRDWKFEYDGLDRLVQAQRGVLSGPMTGGVADTSFTRAPGSQKWVLDALGNWDKFAIDFDNNNPTNADPTFDDPSEFQSRGQHNMANELANLPAISAAPAGTPHSAAGAAFAYDDNGNRTASGWDYASGQAPTTVLGFRFKYTYDAWNRLTKIERAPYITSVGTYSTIAEYTYNGLNWRTTKRTVGGVGGAGNQTLADDATPVLREKRWFWYDAAWRAIAEDVDDDTTNGAAIAGLVNVTGIDRQVQQFFGLRGINDAIYRREDRATKDPSTQALVAPDGRYDTTWGTSPAQTVDTYVYQLADPQGSVVATLFDKGVNPRLVDQVEYDPYGRAKRTRQGDFNHVGDYSPQDIYDFLEAYFAASPAGDANDDGTTSTQDIYDFLGEAQGGETTPGDRISGWSLWGIIDNPYGYCGYYFDHETAAAKVLGPGGGGLYSVRYRVYDPVAGRWLTRDPAGFVDGANLYEYCGGGAVGCFDPTGLITDEALCAKAEANAERQAKKQAEEDARKAKEKEINDKRDQDFLNALRDKLQSGEIDENEAKKLIWNFILENRADLIQAGEADRVGDDIQEYLTTEILMTVVTAPLGGPIGKGVGKVLGKAAGVVEKVLAKGGGEALEEATERAGAKAITKGTTEAGPTVACFVAGTLILTPAGHVPIETIQIGDRVETTETIGQPAPKTVPLTEELWAVQLAMPNPEGMDDVLDIRLLRSREWVIANGAIPGRRIDFVLPEMGLQGPADVVGIDECPSIRVGPGRLVLATVTHLNGFVLALRLAGCCEVLHPTGQHLLFSEDQHDWVAAAMLKSGEKLRRAGGSAIVESITRVPGIHRVFNLEVQTDHCYFVGPMLLLSHNTNPCGQSGKAFSSEKQALVDMAKSDKRTGISAADMQAYKDLNKGLPDPFPENMVRGPEVHPSRGLHAQEPHGHVGPVNHIPVNK